MFPLSRQVPLLKGIHYYQIFEHISSDTLHIYKHI